MDLFLPFGLEREKFCSETGNINFYGGLNQPEIEVYMIRTHFLKSIKILKFPASICNHCVAQNLVFMLTYARHLLCQFYNIRVTLCCGPIFLIFTSHLTLDLGSPLSFHKVPCLLALMVMVNLQPRAPFKSWKQPLYI